MKKKVILLIIIIPLVFMLTLFTVGKAVSVVMRVPVSGIRILTESTDGLLSVDISSAYASSPDSLPVLRAEVLPLNAANREWKYTVSGDAVSLKAASDGYHIVPEKIGTAKISVVSAEGGFTDSVTVEVTSSKLWDYIPEINGGETTLTETPNGECGYAALISGGTYSFSGKGVPASFGKQDAEWSSSDETVLKIDAFTGIARALTDGVVTVSARLEGGPEGVIEKKIAVRVEMDFSSETLFAVNGDFVGDGSVPTVAFRRGVSAPVSVLLQTSDFSSVKGVKVYDDKGSETDCSVAIEPLNPTGAYRLVIEGLETDREGVYKIETTLEDIYGNSVCGSFNVRVTEFDFGIYTVYHGSGSGSTVYQREGTAVTYTAYSEIEAQDVEYTWRLINAGGVKLVSQNGATAQIEVSASGAATLEVTASGKSVSVVRSVEIMAVEDVRSVSVTEAYAEWGMASEMALGRYSVNASGNIVENSYALNVKYRVTEGGTLEDFNPDLLAVTSSDTSVVRVSGGNRLSVVGDGAVTLTAKWKYADYFYADVSAQFTLRAVNDGVNVNDYFSLKTATTRSEGYAVVLQNDVMLGKRGASLSELQSMAGKMPTSYDWQYYENTSKSRPEVYYLIRFTGDVYGNGFEINGDYITRACDAAGSPLLFKGPLSFVEVMGASVKGQDNIVFLADGDITINNVVLKGCSDSGLINDEGKFDLSLLNYVGTTLEICGDVRLINSRVSNGRTLIRAYGGTAGSDGDPVVTSPDKVNAAAERYTVSIESCILSRAREFILKIGTNRALRAVETAPGQFVLPYLTASDGTVYKPDNAVSSGVFGGIPAGAVPPDYSAGSDFYNEFVLTDVTLKDSVLQDSGLFTIGVDTHFAGEALAGMILPDVLTGWRDLAATSYATVLRLIGDVRLLDWKSVANIDSSTLIEVPPGAGESVQQFKLNVAEMLYAVQKTPGYENLMADVSGSAYAHGGIAMYGGGLNYCGMDMSGMNTEKLSKYKINLSILENAVGGSTIVYLSKAAGIHDFVFYMYDAQSDTDYYAENEAVSSGEAYELPVAPL